MTNSLTTMSSSFNRPASFIAPYTQGYCNPEVDALLREARSTLEFDRRSALSPLIRACARRDEEAARPIKIPGIGPIGAMALQAFALPMESFRRGRDFSAWLGLVPRQHTTGGKPRIGGIRHAVRDSPVPALRRVPALSAGACLGGH